MGILTKIFGDANARYLVDLQKRVDEISAYEDATKNLSPEELTQKTSFFIKTVTDTLAINEERITALKNLIRETTDETERRTRQKELTAIYDEPLNTILPEAFALVREAARRTLNQRHFDVQLIGGIVLHRGQIAEMKTGEGKTLTSTLAIYLNALLGKGVHVITVNDYLARRDAIWMGQIFNLLGLSIATIVHDASYLYDPAHTIPDEDKKRDEGVSLEMEYLRPISRKEAYAADITYGTNNEFGFDYLRDNMVTNLDQKVQRPLYYAVIDEADSILIDEARTPLIISAPDTRPTDRYYQFAKLVATLSAPADYTIDEKLRAASLTESGISRVEKALGIDNLYLEEGIQTLHHIEQALKAQALFTKEKDYTIKDGRVVIVDEFTGRLLPGRRYSEGLHQAIEAKEGAPIEQESRTMATVTIQNYFRLYEKLSGMTGTAETEAEELAKIYNLDVTAIPTNKPMVRRDLPDRIYRNEEGKFKAVVDEVKQRYEKGQPVLIGTISIEKNEYLSTLLEREGIPFNVLNAKHHEREAEVIAQAGARGAITLATNMAGRGVDIILGGKPWDEDSNNKIKTLGGLHVIGTERHESRRIDNQLRGRAGRQGDPGSTQFYISLEDDLMRIFGAERIQFLMKSWPADAPIENAMVSKSIESAQKKVEGHNFDIRKHLVEYDDVANKQRMFVYAQRDLILSLAQKGADALRPFLKSKIEEEAIEKIHSLLSVVTNAEETSAARLRGLGKMLRLTESEESELSELIKNNAAHQPESVHNWLAPIVERLISTIEKHAAEHLTGTASVSEVIKFLAIRSIDIQWIEHLETLNYLRTGIGLRGYGQRDPVIEYKREARQLFSDLIASIRTSFITSLVSIDAHVHHPPVMRPQTTPIIERKESTSSFQAAPAQNTAAQPSSAKKLNDQGQKLGRNDPCYCGSGKKYKKCHGA